MRLIIPEILDQVAAAEKKADKLAVLQTHANNTLLKEVLRLNFDPNVTMDLPAGPAPFKADRTLAIGLSESNLYNEGRRLYIFDATHPKYNPNVKKIQKENIWIQILEGCDWRESDMLNIMKDKELQKHYKGLTEALVREAFPGLLTEKQAESPKE